MDVLYGRGMAVTLAVRENHGLRMVAGGACAGEPLAVGA